MKFPSLPIISACAMMAYAVPAAAQIDQLPPAELVAEALSQHPNVLAAEARYQAAEAQSHMLRVGPHEAEISTSASRRTINGDGRYGEFDVTLSRPFRLPAKSRLDKRAGVLGVAAAEAEITQARLEAAQLLRSTWIDWLTAAALVQNDRDMVSTLRRAERAVQRRAQLGDASSLDSEQASAAVAMAQAQLAESEASFSTALATLKSHFPDLVLPVEAPILALDSNLVDDIDLLRQQMKDANPSLAMARTEAERYSVLAQRARADRIADPRFGVRLFSERGGEEKGAGITASIPLGGRYRARIADEAAATARAAQFQLSAVDRAMMAEREASITQAKMLLTVWESTQRAVQFNTLVSDRTSRGQTLGAVDLSELLYAQRQLQESQRAEIKARSEAVQAILKLYIDAQRLWTTAREG